MTYKRLGQQKEIIVTAKTSAGYFLIEEIWHIS